VWLSENDGEFSKVLVDGDHNATVMMSAGQDLLISGVFVPFSGPNDVVPGCFQVGDCTTPHAGVE
jgi:hypothetical protein